MIKAFSIKSPLRFNHLLQIFQISTLKNLPLHPKRGYSTMEKIINTRYLVITESTKDILFTSESNPIDRFQFPTVQGTSTSNQTFNEIISGLSTVSVNFQEDKQKKTTNLCTIEIPSYDTKVEENHFEVIKGDTSEGMKQLDENQSDPKLIWLNCQTVLDMYYSGKVTISADTLLVLKRLLQTNNNFDELSKKFAEHKNTLKPFLKSKDLDLEFAPHIEFIPIKSNTLKPFSITNLIVINSKNECLIIDPGANQEGKPDFIEVLKRLPCTPKVFLTHHHHDHIESLDEVERHFPDAVLLGHKSTLDRVSSKLIKQNLEDGQILSVGEVKLEVIFSPGHTDGHTALFEPVGRSLIAGDHIVGFGSSVLDFECGDMVQYFSSTRRMIELNPRVAFPAHGPASFEPIKMMQGYLKHRTDRESSILEAYRQGGKDCSLDDIVKVVYKDVPSSMWEIAKSNVVLHLRKLFQEGKIQSKF